MIDGLGEYFYGEGDDTLAGAVVSALREKGLTLSAAESVTGGAFSSALVGVPGASAVFLESCVTYSNESKTRLLGVSEETLLRHGAVSAQTAEEMAIGAARASGSDVAISFTGIAGPGGATAEKPVGLVYVSLFKGGQTVTGRHVLFGDRNRVRDRAVAIGFDMVLKALGKKHRNE